MSLCMSSWFDVLLHEDAYCCRLLLAYAGSGNGNQEAIPNSKFLIGTLESLSGPFISTCMIFCQLQKEQKKNKKTTLLSNSLPDSYLSHVQVFFSYWLCSDFEKIKQVHQHRNLPPCLAVVSVSVCVLTDDVNATVSVCEISLQAYTWEVRSCQSKYKI